MPPEDEEEETKDVEPWISVQGLGFRVEGSGLNGGVPNLGVPFLKGFIGVI